MTKTHKSPEVTGVSSSPPSEKRARTWASALASAQYLSDIDPNSRWTRNQTTTAEESQALLFAMQESKDRIKALLSYDIEQGVKRDVDEIVATIEGVVHRACLEWHEATSDEERIEHVRRELGEVRTIRPTIARLIRSLSKGPTEPAAMDGEATAPRKETNRVDYNENDPAFYPNSQAIVDAHFAGREHEIDELQTITAQRLHKLLRGKSGCRVRFMSQKQPPRGRVHRDDWAHFIALAATVQQKADEQAEKIARLLR